MQDSHQYWVEYALEQLNKVQQVATRFDGLEAHSSPDDELVRSTSGKPRSNIRTFDTINSLNGILYPLNYYHLCTYV